MRKDNGGTLRHSSGMEVRKEKKTGTGRPKTTWRRMVDDEENSWEAVMGECMSQPSQQTVVDGKRMSKPYVPYGIKRYRI